MGNTLSNGMHDATKRLSAFAAGAVVAFCCAVFPAAAQVPTVSPEFYNPIRPAEGQGIRFCVWTDTSTAAFDRAVAEEIASALLLRPSFYDIDVPSGSLLDEEFWNLMFIRLTESCSAMMAGVLAPSVQLEDWLTISQPYLRSPYIALTGSDDLESLGDLGPRGLLGTPFQSTVDLVVLNYLQTQPSDQRWRRLPYENVRLMLDHLEQGDLTAGIVWQPILAARAPEGPESLGLREISTAPLQTTRRELGVMLRSDDAALRTSIDQAISALWSDGTLEALAEEHGILNGP